MAATETLQSLALAWGVAVSVLAALVFARAGLLKIRTWSSLAGVVDDYDLLPSFAAPAVAAVLPVAEIALAAALAVSAVWSVVSPAPWLAWAQGAAAALLLVFALAMAINLARGRGYIDCGCGDTGIGQTLGLGLVIRNLAMVAGLTIAALTGRAGGGSTISGSAGPGAAMIGLAAGGAGFLLYLCQETFAALPGPARAAPLPPPDARFGFAAHRRTGVAR